MNKVEIQVPPLPESVSDGELVRWHKQVGDFVRRDENLVDLETGRVIEFQNEELEELKARIADELGYELVDHRLELYGRRKKK